MSGVKAAADPRRGGGGGPQVKNFGYGCSVDRVSTGLGEGGREGSHFRRFLTVKPDRRRSLGAGRGFVRKIVIPFLLGLKFKTTVLIPVAIAIIALKTWKALTLGLLSLVLSAAMVIYRFTKPKVVGVEILHYPTPVHAHHHDGYAHARAYGAQMPADRDEPLSGGSS